MTHTTLRVTYLELTDPPARIPDHFVKESVSAEKLSVDEYLDLYRRVGKPLRWDQRLKMPRSELIQLIHSGPSQIYVLRQHPGEAIGFCEFERSPPDVELKNFGLLPSFQGKGLGSWLLRVALHQEWQLRPRRIWLHTDNWDHPAAVHVYQHAGFRIYAVRDEPPGDL